jgi:hypothetical protein
MDLGQTPPPLPNTGAGSLSFTMLVKLLCHRPGARAWPESVSAQPRKMQAGRPMAVERQQLHGPMRQLRASVARRGRAEARASVHRLLRGRS